MINKERTRFALQFAGKIKTKSLCLSFLGLQKTMYDDIMYKNEEIFIEKLIELIPQSIDYILDLTGDQKKEWDMFNRIENICKKFNYIYERNNTNSNSIDFYINRISYQGKYCSLNRKTGKTYCIHLQKGTRNFIKPYNISDQFEYVIIEVGGIKSENELDEIKYHGYFCIIPKITLIKQGILRFTIKKDGIEKILCEGKK